MMRRIAEDNLAHRLEANKREEEYKAECEKTYESCKGIDIFSTETANKYGIVFRNLKNQTRNVWKPILHELAGELGQFNNDGLGTILKSNRYGKGKNERQNDNR